MYNYFKRNIQPEVNKLDDLLIGQELTRRELARQAQMSDQEIDAMLTKTYEEAQAGWQEACDHSAFDDPDYGACPDCGETLANLKADDYEARTDIEIDRAGL